MLLIPFVYGLVHLRALSIMFPTPIERLLWKIACYILVGAVGGGCLMALMFSLEMVREAYTKRHASPAERITRPIYLTGRLVRLSEKSIRWIVGLLSVAIAVVYVAARLYIVIESFISLRHVPIGVYQTPDSNFMDYIPHL